MTSIFLGGGTPSLMEPATVGALLDAVAGAWGVARDVEVTLEANPTSVEAGRFRGYRAAGVNRVSLGVQALNDPDLKRLGRLHGAAEAMAAVETAAAHFERFSFDLIYARPDQSPDAGRRSCARRSRAPPSTCRSTSSPSRRGRRSTASPPPGGSPCRTTTRPAPSTT